MKLPNRTNHSRNRALLAACTLAIAYAPFPLLAADAPAPKAPAPKELTAAEKAKADLAKKPAVVPAAAEVKAAAAKPADLPDDEAIVLSPFEVVGENNGYMATNSASGTRLNSRLEDVAAPISVVTKQQLQDMAAVDLNDIFRSEANVEGFYQYTETGLDRGNLVDTASNNPEANNRIRGMGQANITAGGMSVSSATPIDSYNIDSVEISRGANSNIFGIGSTSGTVNLNLSTANLSKDVTKFSFMTDNLGRLRETFDISRVILKNKLAVRLIGAHDKLGFVREPSNSSTKRFTLAVRAQPFRKTSIKASYETYVNNASLPNALTPREAISSWQSRGSFTWDASTYTVYNAAGSPVGQYDGRQSLPNTTPVVPIIGLGTSVLLRDTYGFQGGDLDSGNQRPIIGYIDGQVAYFTNTSAWRFNRLTGTPLAPQYLQNGNQRLVDYNAPAVQIYVPEVNPVTGLPFGLVNSAFSEQLPGVHGDAGKAFYDWTKYNLLASNHARRQSRVARAELEQYVVNTSTHQLAFQVAALYEDLENKSWNYIGNGGDGVQLIIYPDVNRTLPSGAPNPGYLRPVIRARQPQIYYRPEENHTHKAQVAYMVDLTQNDGWSKWLGKHNLLGYGEYRERRFSPNAIRYRSQIVNNTDNGAINHQGNSDSLNTRYYLGDASGFNLDSPTTSPPTEGVFPYTYSSANYTTVGTSNFDAGQFLTTPTKLAEIYFSQGTQKNETRTKGLLWQGFLLNGRIVPTIGWRQDKTRFIGSQQFLPNISTTAAQQVSTAPGQIITVNPVSSPYVIDGYPSSTYYDPTHGLFEFGNNYIITNPRTGANERRGQTRTQGVVVKPLQGLTKFSLLNGLSLWYNRSASFEPAGLAIDTYGDIVDDPTGKSEDYGVRFSLLNERLWISLSKYKATTINARNAGANVVAQRAIPFDVDTGNSDPDASFADSNSPNQKDLFDWYFYRIFGNASNAVGQNVDLVPAYNGTGDLLYMQQKGLIGGTSAETLQRVTDHIFGLMQYSKDIVRKRNNAPGATSTATNDVTSKGYELEVLYRTKNFNFKVTGAKKATIDSNIAGSLTKYIADRRPVLEAATYTPLSGTGVGVAQSYWNSTFGGTVTHGDSYFSEVYSVYSPLVANLGKPRPQIRQYSVAVTSSYNLSGMFDNRILKSISVGGGGTWVSKGAIGYGYRTPVQDKVTGAIQINDLDVTRAFYDRARYTANAWARYDFRMYSGRIKSSVQLNVQNLLEEGRLQRVHVRTDGVADIYRIVDPRLFQLTLNMEL